MQVQALTTATKRLGKSCSNGLSRAYLTERGYLEEEALNGAGAWNLGTLFPTLCVQFASEADPIVPVGSIIVGHLQPAK